MTDDNKLSVEQWRAIRKEEGLKIDPATAEVDWSYEQVLDPYGVCPDLPEECQQVGRAYFARRPGSDIWVEFGDLPEKTREALWSRHGSRLVSLVITGDGRVVWNVDSPGDAKVCK
jgi:hypothetical protein